MPGLPERRKLGAWRLGEKLGSGGNATVWAAVRDDGAEFAVKVLNSTKANREPYQRFAREIAVLRALVDVPGVLPIVDAALPDAPSSTEPAWLAMPIANPISEALRGASLPTAVEAIGAIAETLARLASEHGIAHRDIKPGNLYELSGTWLVGDFGLVALPDIHELTRTGRPLGPAHYLAYEMLRDPTTADPFPADVYSLAKTLWVLATGQNYPPQGHQPADGALFTIAETRPHPHATTLDRLIDRMTRIRPTDRPSMAEVAGEIEEWRRLPNSPSAIDVSDVRAKLRAKVAIELATQDLREQQRDHAQDAARRFQELFRPVTDALREVHPRAELNVSDDQYTQNTVKNHRYARDPQFVWHWQRCSRINVGAEQMPYSLRVGRWIALDEEGELVMHAFIDAGHVRFGAQVYAWSLEPAAAPVGTVAADQMLSDTVNAVLTELPAALAAFVEGIPDG